MPKFKTAVAIYLLLIASVNADEQFADATENIAPDKPASVSFTVQPNQSLSKIMLENGLQLSLDLVKLISQHNNLAYNEILQPGDVVKIPMNLLDELAASNSLTNRTSNISNAQIDNAAQNIAPEKPASLTFTIRPNQSLSKVMLENGLQPSQDLVELISQHNNLASNEILYPGDQVKIPVKLLPPTTTGTSSLTDDTVCVLEICFEEATSTQEESVTESNEISNQENSNQENSNQVVVQPTKENAEPGPDLTLDEIAAAIESAKQTPATPPSVAKALPAPEASVDTEVPLSQTQQQPVPEQNQATQNNSKNKLQATQAQQESPPKSAPGLFEVDEDAAIRALERSLVRINALLLQSGEIESSMDLSYSYDQSRTVSLVEILNEDTPTTTVGEIEDLRNSYTANLGLTIGLPQDSQVRLQLPITRRDAESNVLITEAEVDGASASATGTGDFSISLAKTLLREAGRGPDVIAQVTYDSDTGKSDSDIQLGNNHESVALSVRATKRQDPLVFSYGLSYTALKSKDNFSPGAQTTFSLSTLLAASPYTSLLFSFNHTIINSAKFNNETIRGSKSIDSTINLGISSVIGIRTFMSAGVIAGLTDATNDYTAYVGFSRRFRY